jgi:arginine exporter protein ArgO
MSLLGSMGKISAVDAALMLVAGVFLGSAAWWFILTWGVSIYRAKFSAKALQWVNRVSGVVITFFGLAALLG